MSLIERFFADVTEELEREGSFWQCAGTVRALEEPIPSEVVLPAILTGDFESEFLMGRLTEISPHRNAWRPWNLVAV